MRSAFYLLALVALVPSAVFAQNCYSCSDTVAGGSCSTLVGETPIACSSGTQCFRMEAADGRVQRGCASDMFSVDRDACLPGTNCRLCEGNLCNAKIDFQRCHRCSTAAEDCPQLQNANQNQYVCNEYLDECAILIDGANTLRGCRAELNLPETCNSLTCSTGTENYSNGGVFPVNRLQCNMCSGTAESCITAITDTAQRRVCNNLVIVNDQCYTAVNDNRQVFRGCLSDNDAGVTQCQSGNCVTCFASGCNSVAARSPATLSCVQCLPILPTCAWGFEESDATLCRNEVWLGETETCYQRTYMDGTAERGCLLDNNYVCEENDTGCMTCDSDGCNRITIARHNCYQCRSAQDEGCFEPEESNLESTACPSMNQQMSDAGCYVLEQDNGNVVRGCVRGLDEKLLGECLAGDRCEICTEDGCNSQRFGAAGALKALSFGFLLLVAVFVRLF